MVTAIVVLKMTTLMVKARKRRGMGGKDIFGVNTPTHRPESTRKEEVGKQRNSEPLELPSGPLTLGVGAQRQQDAQKKRVHAQSVHDRPAAIVQS